jgi:hypothetical protein
MNTKFAELRAMNNDTLYTRLDCINSALCKMYDSGVFQSSHEEIIYILEKEQGMIQKILNNRYNQYTGETEGPVKIFIK